MFCPDDDFFCKKFSNLDPSRPSLSNQPKPFRSKISSSCQLFLPFFDCRFLILHSVNLTGLEPGRRYRYRIFADEAPQRRQRMADEFKEKTSTSDVFDFVYPDNFDNVGPSLTFTSSPQRFMLFSDTSVDDRGGIIDALVKEVEENSPVDMMLSMGDYGYDLVTPRGEERVADLLYE